ncbi:MAG: class I SAM-dependent methyltransferase [Desulfobacteraceae bacterium]|jgi:SAM-dependent methyltransferase
MFDFKDYFSNNSANYSKFRPVYPDALFDYLAGIAPSSALAWDCATGSGQAAQKLARRFSRVIATDASSEQLRKAKPVDNIAYRVAPAEKAPFPDNAVDLITVAQALHWFDIELFFREAKRVLKTDGVIAVWTYNLLTIEPALDKIINGFYENVLGPYWPPERVMVEDGYRDISFPFQKLLCPAFSMSASWSLNELLGYLGTWSAVKQYRDKMGSDPLDIIRNDLAAQWGAPDRRYHVDWPLSVRVGSLSQPKDRAKGT